MVMSWFSLVSATRTPPSYLSQPHRKMMTIQNEGSFLHSEQREQKTGKYGFFRQGPPKDPAYTAQGARAALNSAITTPTAAGRDSTERQKDRSMQPTPH